MKQYKWQGHSFCLHPHRLMYWEEEKTLIGSDLHLGKIGHFRKAGIALPQQAAKKDLHRLFAALQYFQPRRFLVVGDLFHSSANKEMDWFLRWRSDLPAVDFLLVRGNHDLLSNDWYRQNGIEVCPYFVQQGLQFLHDPHEQAVSAEHAVQAVVSGHIHPGIKLSGFGGQSVQLPCFYFSSSQCILPAFGQFTGLYTVRPQANDAVFALLENEVVEIGKK
jgi:uncharacterized protein